MKKAAATLICLLLLATSTEAVGLVSHATGVLKCPLCKMKMQKIDDCRCHKKKPISAAKIHYPCGDNEGDFHISFDRIQGVTAPVVFVPAAMTSTQLFYSHSYRNGITTDIPQPPPRQ